MTDREATLARIAHLEREARGYHKMGHGQHAYNLEQEAAVLRASLAGK